jgi:hypothetical protein
MVDKWIFCALDKSLDRQSFDCGVVELNDYLHRYASQNHRKGIATTFVAIANADDRQIAGYYSVSMSEIWFYCLTFPANVFIYSLGNNQINNFLSAT